MLKKYFKKNKSWLILVLVLFFGLIIRTKNFNVLPVDAHPMRQTDTECVAYFLYSGKSTFLKPKACLIRPVSNIDGYFFLEMPFYEGLIALGYRILGPEIWVGRLINLILYIVGSLALFDLIKKWINKETAVFGLIIYFSLCYLLRSEEMLGLLAVVKRKLLMGKKIKRGEEAVDHSEARGI